MLSRYLLSHKLDFVKLQKKKYLSLFDILPAFFLRHILQFPIWPEKPNKYLEKTSYILKLKILLEGWTESSARKNTCCFYGGPVIGFQNQHGSSRSSVTPKSAHQALNMHMAHIQRKAHTSEIKIHEKIKSLFHSKIKLSYGVFLWS